MHAIPNSRTRTHTHTLTHARKPTHSHTQTLTDTHIHTYPHTHTDTHTRTRARAAGTHTHARARALAQVFWLANNCTAEVESLRAGVGSTAGRMAVTAGPPRFNGRNSDSCHGNTPVRAAAARVQGSDDGRPAAQGHRVQRVGRCACVRARVCVRAPACACERVCA
jgi:hypothetical protein